MDPSWDDKKAEIEQAIQSGITVGALASLSPATITVEVDETFRDFRRRGYLECVKWVVKESENPCRLTPHHNGEVHKATIKLSAEEVNEIATSFSESATRSLSATISSEITASAGVEGVASTSATIGSSITGSLSRTEASSTAIARKIRSLLEIEEPIELSSHVQSRCKQLSVPYGLELVVTMRGTLTLSRGFVQDLNNPQSIQWSDNINVVDSDLDVQASIDPKLKTDESETSDTRCDACDDGRVLPPEESRIPEPVQPKGDKRSKEQKQKKSAGRTSVRKGRTEKSARRAKAR